MNGKNRKKRENRPATGPAVSMTPAVEVQVVTMIVVLDVAAVS
jgi:hypothetical protein